MDSKARRGQDSKMFRLISGVLVCLCLATTSAVAQTDDVAAAKASYASGERHYDLAEYEPALADFKEAYRNKPDPAFLYNIAQCHRKLGHIDEAIHFYQTYLRRAQDAKNRQDVERRIAELEALRSPANPYLVPGTSHPATAAVPTTAPSALTPATPASTTPVMPTVQPTTEQSSPKTSPPAAFDFNSREEATRKSDSRFYQTWWFWTTVGVLAAGAATVAIIMAERDPTKIPTSTLGSQNAMP